VVRVTRESFHLGGAANVAANVRALGGQARIVGIVGRDAFGRQVVRELRHIGVGVAGVVQSRAFPTVRKIRILAHQQQVVRLDRERPADSPALAAEVLRRVLRILRSVDGVVVSDYGKGVVTPELLASLAERRDGRPNVFIDPKKGNFAHYRRATLVKPNLEAAAQASGIEIADEASLQRAGERLVRMWESDAVLVSRGEEGMSLFQPGRRRHFPTAAREVYDVTGAGDTVLATAALAVGAGASFEEAAVLANRAAGIVVAKVGTECATAEELLHALREDPSS
jgi:rfaE bifunctional protein kinase chain/domain